MVFTQILMDSVSRCFGVPEDSPSNSAKFGDQPLGASREARQHSSSPGDNEHTHNSEPQDFCQNSHDCHHQQTQVDATGRPVYGQENFMSKPNSTSNHQRRSSRDQYYHKDNSISLDTRLLTTPPNPNPHISDTDSTALAQARHQAFQQPNSKRRNSQTPTKSPTPTKLPLTHEASIEKARTKCSKRKLDIFRTPQNTRSKSQSTTSSFAFRILGDAPFPSGAMLCFANPILDEEEEMKLQRVDEMLPEDEETVASTLYFDAKYAHVVEKQPPFGLLPSFRVEEGGNLLDIFQSGSHKTITSITCPSSSRGGPSPSLDKESRMESMADETSDEEDSDEGEESRTSTEEVIRNMNGHKSHSSPSLYHPQDLDVISVVGRSTERNDAVDMRNLKLMSNSSQSTAALTPVCSSRSHGSMNTVPEGRHRVTTPIDANKVHETIMH